MSPQDRPNVGELYDRSTGTSDLTLRPGKCDADVLMAAGYAAQGSRRAQVALSLYRMRATGDRHGLADVLHQSADWLLDWKPPPGIKRLRKSEAADVAKRVVKWWMAGVCNHCQGRQYELIPGTRVCSDDVCPACHGRGREPVEQWVLRQQQEPARWLASEYDQLVSSILSNMARRLRPE